MQRDAPSACWNDTRFRFVSAAAYSVRDVHITQGSPLQDGRWRPKLAARPHQFVCRAVIGGTVSV